MTSTQRPDSVRARGTRRLKQATVGMVVVGVGGVVGLAVHDSQQAHASGSTSSTQNSTTTSTSSATDSSGSGSTGDMSSTSGSSTVTATQSTPQATSGGS